VATLLKSGELVLWSLDNFEQVTSSQFPHGVTTIDLCEGFAVGSGPSFSAIVFQRLNGGERTIFKLPEGYNGVTELKLLRDPYLCAFLSEGQFFVADLSCEEAAVKLNIRIPHQTVTHFDVDFQMGSVLLSTNTGKVFLYDL